MLGLAQENQNMTGFFIYPKIIEINNSYKSL